MLLDISHAAHNDGIAHVARQFKLSLTVSRDGMFEVREEDACIRYAVTVVSVYHDATDLRACTDKEKER